METTWASGCNSLLQHFFERLLQHIRNDDEASGLRMLTGLSERNEFHLGFSRGRSKGSGIGPEFARDLWRALNRSKAGKTGILKDLEDACLFIDGVGPDRISDATCNILRGPLIRYTHDMCDYYGIPLQDGISSGPIWNPETDLWEEASIALPVTNFGPLVLVPKIAVRHRLSYDPQRYYTHYLLPAMQSHEKSINSGLVYTLRSGEKRVTKKSLRKTYGADKLSITLQTDLHPKALEEYRLDRNRTSSPITHEQLAEIENISGPRFHQLLEAVTSLAVGKDSASAYENAIEALLTAVLFPSLSTPTKQHKLHEGRKRIDITYVNCARSGFFSWLAANYSAAHVFIECKNYGKEIGNPEIDQLSSRFGPSRGQFGILVCRSTANDSLLTKRCADTAKDQRGFIVHLTDADLKTLVDEFIASDGESNYPILRKKFTQLVM